MRDSTADRVDPGVLIDTLPLGVIVTDALGTVVHANRRAEELTGYSVDEVRGRSMLDFIAPDDLEYVIASLGEGHRYQGVVIGPSRIRYVAADGELHWTEYWAHSCPPEFGFEGYVLTLSTESVGDNLSQAVHDIALGEPLEVCLASVARAVRAFPLIAEGTILLPAGDGFTVIGTWPFTDPQFLRDISLPWHEVARTGDPLDLFASDLPEPLTALAAAAGFRSLWIRPVTDEDGDLLAVFVAWRREEKHTSTNQDRHLVDTVGVARLALMQDAHRRQLHRAALVDALTGVGNRAGLRRRLDELGDDPYGVLFIDLDGFKGVNDSHGHDVGDIVLSAASNRLVAVVRGRDAVFRLGGDEFLVICDTGDDVSAGGVLERIATRVVNALRQPFRVDDELTVEVGASVGATGRRTAEAPETAISRADRALYEAKRNGKAQWRLAAD